MSSSANQLQRVVGLPGAILMGLGSIIGAGVFISLGLGEQIAGPSVLLALVIAGGVATCNGLSSAQLAANHSVSGGTYEYGHRWLSPYLGFSAGWMFLCAKSASAATAALGFAIYFAPDHTIAVGLGTVAVLTIVTLTGMQRSNAVNAVIVSAVLLSLLAYVAIGLPSLQINNEFLSPIFDSTRKSAFLEATALMFVAYTGYGRIATLGEEVREPRRTIPVAIIVTLLLTVFLYLGVCAVSLAHAQGQGFESLRLLAEKMGGKTFGMILALGAALALAEMPSLARTFISMGMEGCGSDQPWVRSNSFMTSTRTSTLERGRALYMEARKPPTERCPLMPLMPAAAQASRKSGVWASSAAVNVAFITLRESAWANPLKRGLRSISP